MKIIWALSVPVIITATFGLYTKPAQAAVKRDITFPVIGTTSYSDDFGAPRVGHTHAGNDIFGKKMQPLVAAVDGTIRFVAYPEPSYGWYINLTDSEGYQYDYIHINNDTPGTDDGKGGAMNAYAPGTAQSWTVKRGQVIAYLGDSGNAESTSSHLHFEIRLPDDTAIDPYTSLRAATHVTKAAVPAVQTDELTPFASFHVGANIVVGDVTPNYPGNELVFGSAAGAKPQILFMTPQGRVAGGFFLPTKGFLGGADVAVGDVNSDGSQEIVASLGAGSSPRVYVLDRHGVILSQFDAYDPLFRGGVRVSTADLNGDGTAEIITGAGPGGGPEVRTFTMTGQLLSSFMAYTPRFHSGIDVAGLSATGSSPGLIITSPGKSGGPDVREYSQTGELRISFIAGIKTFSGGLHVTLGTDAVSGQPMIYTVPASGGSGLISSFTMDGVAGQTWSMYEVWWRGGFDIAVDGTTMYGAINTNNRRSSVMRVTQHIFQSQPRWHHRYLPDSGV